MYACSKVDVAGPQGPPGADGVAGSSNLTGSISGKIRLYDSLGNPVSDNSGATISLDSTSPLIQASSAGDGNFSLNSVKAGNYNLTASKQGYGAMHIFNFQNTGGVNPSQTGNIEMGQQVSSNLDIRNLSVDTSSYGSYHFMVVTITLAHPQKTSNPVLLYISHASGVGNQSNDYVFRSNYFQQNDSTLILSPLDISPSYYSDNLYRIDYLYMAAAFDNPHVFTYTDEMGNTVYPSAGKLSNEVKVYNIFKD
jgi:hypothetical protein